MKNPRNYYATFCIDNGNSRKLKCFTVRPNFKTKGQALEAAYKAGRAKVDSMVKETMWALFTKKLRQAKQNKNSEKRKTETVYLT